MPGPLPDPKRRRRNKPTIPTTNLSATGPDCDPPEVPEAYELGDAGIAWWKWAWQLPQACAWDDGALYVVARRARLEDDLAALEDAEHSIEVLDDLIAMAVETESPIEFKSRLRNIDLTVRKLKSLAGGSTSLMKEMREIDNRLGLNPKALADLRWTIMDGEEKPAVKPSATAKQTNRRSRLELVA